MTPVTNNNILWINSLLCGHRQFISSKRSSLLFLVARTRTYLAVKARKRTKLFFVKNGVSVCSEILFFAMFDETKRKINRSIRRNPYKAHGTRDELDRLGKDLGTVKTEHKASTLYLGIGCLQFIPMLIKLLCWLKRSWYQDMAPLRQS